jgi:hypothetical protein
MIFDRGCFSVDADLSRRIRDLHGGQACGSGRQALSAASYCKNSGTRLGEGHRQESAVTECSASSGQLRLKIRSVQKREGLKHICTVLCPI